MSTRLFLWSALLIHTVSAFSSPRSIFQQNRPFVCATRNKNIEEQQKQNRLSKLVHIYTDYAGRLWDETSLEARERMTQSLANNTTKLIVEPVATTAPPIHDDDITTVASTNTKTTTTTATKKPRRSVGFGALMGLLVTSWVFSGNYIFTTCFTLMTILGQLEYYRMVMSTGVYPARRISVIGACSMFLTALMTPDLHQICLPMFGIYTMIWFLTMKRTPTTIPEIATTFTGMFYLGYVPSFWVRLRVLGGNREPTRLASIAGPMLRYLEQKGKILPEFVTNSVIHLPITSGAIFIFWTWLCLAFNDVGAYFMGRKFGRTKLSVISPAAAATSPNKTIEGLLGGCLLSAALAIFGAWVQKWPFPIVSGGVHGIVLGLLGFLGDLSASMLKRDAGMKDFGDLIPEHGGIMDRVDGFIWTAPYSYVSCVNIYIDMVDLQQLHYQMARVFVHFAGVANDCCVNILLLQPVVRLLIDYATLLYRLCYKQPQWTLLQTTTMEFDFVISRSTERAVGCSFATPVSVFQRSQGAQQHPFGESTTTSISYSKNNAMCYGDYSIMHRSIHMLRRLSSRPGPPLKMRLPCQGAVQRARENFGLI